LPIFKLEKLKTKTTLAALLWKYTFNSPLAPSNIAQTSSTCSLKWSSIECLGEIVFCQIPAQPVHNIEEHKLTMAVVVMTKSQSQRDLEMSRKTE